MIIDSLVHNNHVVAYKIKDYAFAELHCSVIIDERILHPLLERLQVAYGHRMGDWVRISDTTDLQVLYDVDTIINVMIEKLVEHGVEKDLAGYSVQYGYRIPYFIRENEFTKVELYDYLSCYKDAVSRYRSCTTVLRYYDGTISVETVFSCVRDMLEVLRWVCLSVYNTRIGVNEEKVSANIKRFGNTKYKNFEMSLCTDGLPLLRWRFRVTYGRN